MACLILFILALLSSDSSAQSKWTVYLGPDMHDRYTAESLKDSTGDGIHYTVFPGYDIFLHQATADSQQDKGGRDGILLNAKSTVAYMRDGIISFGNSHHLALITYHQVSEVTRHGRSAAVSILNLFSKKEDRNPQAEPGYEEKSRFIAGSIRLAGKAFPYSYSTRNNYMTADGDTVSIVQASRFRKRKSGKVKNRKNSYEAVLLMKNDQIIAAMDYNQSPVAFYIRRGLNENEKLLYTAFFLIRSLHIPLPEY
ncbi:MAG TPA: hypothetical protein PKC69_00100 [Chitinophagaceae bacterium]|nr:hypothetical protein [Chitinophagaceae bacterium]